MGIMRYLLLYIFMFFGCSTLLAQPDDAETIVKDGKVYYVHVVQNGNTLWGIHTLYNVEVQKIIAENPGAENGINVGQRLLIPSNLPSANGQAVLSNGKTHVVEAKQTLYGISRIYKCSVEELIALNPGVENGLNVGQVLKLPSKKGEVQNHANKPIELPSVKYDIQFSDSTIQHVVTKKETLYSISKRYMVSVQDLVKVNGIKNNKIKPGETIIIPLKKERITPVLVRPIYIDTTKIDSLVVEFKEKETYKVAVLLPFYLSKNSSILSGVYTNDTELNRVSYAAVDFYMGMKLALDSLKQLGLKAEVSFHDTKNDSASVAKILNSKELKDLDLIIGPLYPKRTKQVAEWCKKNQVRMVSPVPMNTENLKDNPYVYSAVPSDLTLIKSMAKYLATYHADDNVVLVKSGSERDEVNYKMFREQYAEYLPDNAYRGILKETSMGSTSGSDLSYSVVKDTLTIFIYLSKSESNVMKFMTTLNKVKNKSGGFSKARIIACGLNDWTNYADVNNYYLNRFNIHYASANNLNYSTPEMISFIKKYRAEYAADPSKYGVQGFDVAMYYMYNFFIDENYQTVGLMNQIKPIQCGFGNGYENNTSFILFQNNFEIKQAAILND